ncbi:Transcriptional regulator KdgR [Variovorax sp. PBL-H6]|nr:Transcriptional regulator KdgR [Variovorax sp. PBL-H6]
MGVSEIAAQIGMPKSGAHRLLQGLVAEHYVSRRSAGTYSVSIKLWELGSAALFGFDLRRKADGVMEALMENTGETVHLSVLDGYQVVYVHKVENAHPVRSYSQIAGRVPAHCVATGKAMIAFKTSGWLDHAVQQLVAATPRTITRPAAFLAEMQKIRSCGYAVNRGEWRTGVNGIAAPIFDGTGAVIAAIGLSGAHDTLNEQRLGELSEQVRQTAQDLSDDLGKSAPHASLLGVINRWGALV